MESIQGKQSLYLEPALFVDRLAVYENVLVDIGTGDGRFVKTFAEAHPDFLAIGIDTCRENLSVNSRGKLPNALYLICPARSLPAELYGRASIITINFPWGSLLSGLLDEDPALLSGLAAIAKPDAVLELRVNADALLERGLSIDQGHKRIQRALAISGFKIRLSNLLGPRELRLCQTTWAKRLAFGRDPRALNIAAERI
jgi:16S rRNA (adenine(1408)-N(1))-methyltransferase